MKIDDVPDLQNTALYYYEQNEPPKFVFVQPRPKPPKEAKQITIVGEKVSSETSSSSSSTQPLAIANDPNIPPAPPLPDWANHSSHPVAKSKMGFRRLAISKKKKEDDKPKKTVGMGDLMSELRDKIGGGKMKMKKVETKVGKLHHKKGGKKKGGFTDIMDELSHTLARLRGDILDDSPVKSPSSHNDTGEEGLPMKDVAEGDAAIGSEKDILAIVS